MPGKPDIRVATAHDIPEVQRLFREYERWLDVDLLDDTFDAGLRRLGGRRDRGSQHAQRDQDP